jgi:hypothetical protein
LLLFQVFPEKPKNGKPEMGSKEFRFSGPTLPVAQVMDLRISRGGGPSAM